MGVQGLRGQGTSRQKKQKNRPRAKTKNKTLGPYSTRGSTYRAHIEQHRQSKRLSQDRTFNRQTPPNIPKVWLDGADLPPWRGTTAPGGGGGVSARGAGAKERRRAG
jgi:hypothetical protein